MKIDFAPEFISTCMELWRNTAELKVEMLDEFKMHFMSNRGSILRNFENTASAWSMMLGQMKPASEEDAEQLSELVAQVGGFKEWVKAEQEKLNRMAIEEEIQDGIAELLNDPTAREATIKLLGQLRGPKKKP